jgi:hypothetical protein
VQLREVYDVQVAHVLAFASSCRHLPSLLSVIETNSAVSEKERSRARAAKCSGPFVGADGCYNSKVWLQRPLEEKLLQYAAGDVAVLLPLHRQTMDALKLQLQPADIVLQLSRKRIEACIDSSLGRSRGSERDFYEGFCTDIDAANLLLRRLTCCLRESYCYCLWCKVRYSSKQELVLLCPGDEEDDH